MSPEGQFATAPEFISQYLEKKKGHDVEVAIDGSTPVFFQFKRSQVMVSMSAREFKEGCYSEPVVYRMELYRRHDYQQHFALQAAEALGESVFYVTSQVEDRARLTQSYLAKSVVSSASALFSPNEIVLPNLNQQHHLSFKACEEFGYMFSDQGIRFERSVADAARWLEDSKRDAMDRDGNRKRMKTFVERMLGPSVAEMQDRSPMISPQARDMLLGLFDGINDPVKQASILAFVAFDAHLTFVRGGEDR